MPPTQAKHIAQRLAEAAMFLPGPLTKHHAAPLLVRRDDIAGMLLNAGLREAVEQLEKARTFPRYAHEFCENALTALRGKIKPYIAADDPEIRAGLQRAVNGDG